MSEESTTHTSHGRALPIWTEAHKGLIYTNGHRSWVICGCGYRTEKHSAQTKAVRVFTQHMAFATERKRALFRKRSSAWESLSRADRHIDRCDVCGAQVWDGSCGTCRIQAERAAKSGKRNNAARAAKEEQ